ncbi:MAG: hypothetical protein ABSG76_25735, partial [Xanthobacteraceae bacterium]
MDASDDAPDLTSPALPSPAQGADALAGRTRIDIAFGRGHLPVCLPARAEPTVIRKAALPKLPDPSGAIRRAFEHPMGARPL